MPYRERDLVDDVLAGRADVVPDTLRPVADALAALRAAPSDAELSGEAAARAEFRAMLHGGGHAGPERTLVLPLVAAGPPSRRSARHHHRRRGSRPRLLFSPVVLLAAAAAVVLVLFGVTGIGSLNSIAHFGHPAATNSAAALRTGQRAAGPSVQGTAANEPTPSPGASHSGAPAQANLRGLCKQYIGFFSHPQSAAAWRAERELGNQIARLANLTKLPEGPFLVFSTCERQLIGPAGHGVTSPPGGQSGLNDSQANQGSTGANSTGLRH